MAKKRLLFIFLTIGVLCAAIFGGCTNNAPGSPENTAEVTAGGESVTVYYLKGNANFNLAISSFEKNNKGVSLVKKEFSSAEEMDDVLINELNAGSGSDVIFFNEKTSLNVLTLAKNGVFASLDSFIQNDPSFDENEFITGALDAGKINGEQIFMPASFRLHVAFHGNSLLGGDTAIWEADDFFASIEKSIDDRKNDDMKSSLLLVSETPIFTQLMRLYRVKLISEDGRNVQIDEALLKKVTETAKSVLDEQIKSKNIVSVYAKDFPSVTSRISYLWWNGIDLPYDLWGYQSLYKVGGDDMAFSVISGNAQVDLFGAVTKKASANASAYQLLRALVNAAGNSNNEVVYGMPVLKTNFQQGISYYSDLTANSNVSGSTTTILPLSDDNQKALVDAMDRIQGFYIPNPKIESMAEDVFTPYFSGMSSYEDCFNTLRGKLDLYINE